VGVQEKFNVEKKLGVKIGDPIVPESHFSIMANPKLYMSKAFDNRVSCALVLDILKKFKNVKHPNTILGCASVQEEVGLRGAQTMAHVANPDVCIVLDTGIGQDVPPDGIKKREPYEAV